VAGVDRLQPGGGVVAVGGAAEDAGGGLGGQIGAAQELVVGVGDGQAIQRATAVNRPRRSKVLVMPGVPSE